MKYLLYLPKDYEQKDSWPLLLFLHGAGGVRDLEAIESALTQPAMTFGGEELYPPRSKQNTPETTC